MTSLAAYCLSQPAGQISKFANGTHIYNHIQPYTTLDEFSIHLFSTHFLPEGVIAFSQSTGKIKLLR